MIKRYLILTLLSCALAVSASAQDKLLGWQDDLINDTTVVRMYWYSIPTAAPKMHAQLNVIYSDGYYKRQRIHRVDTFNVASAQAFADSTFLLPIYNELGDSAQRVIQAYFRNNFPEIKAIIEVKEY